MKHTELTLQDRHLTRLLDGCARFALGALLSGGQVFGEYAPLGLGLVAASGAGTGGFAALAGAILGAFLFMDFTHGLRYLAVGLLLFSANNAFSGTKFYQKPLFLPLLSMGLTLAVEAVYLLRAQLQACAYCLIALLLTGLSAHLFRTGAARAAAEPTRQLSWLLLTAGVLMSLSRFCFFGGVSLGRTLAALCVLLIAYEQGGLVGLCCGMGLGLAMDLAGTAPAFLYAAMFGVGALFTSLRARGRRPAAALLFALPVTVLLLPLPASAGLVPLYEILSAALVFLLLPTRLLRSGKRLRPAPALAGHEQLRTQLEQVSAAFRELYDSLTRTPQPPTEENPAVVFDRAAEQVCRDCDLRTHCWEREYVATFNALNDATPAMLARGRTQPVDFPTHFADRCVHFAAFRGAIDHQLSLYLLRRQYLQQLQETRRSAKGQYACISEVFSSTAGRFGREDAAKPARRASLPYQVGMALRQREGEAVSGDSAAFFESGGVLYLLLSDGMGSGEAAQRESALAARLLERFLRSGIEPAPALKTLNAALALHSEETAGFTTIDLCALTLAAGTAALYKYGAAPTYVKKLGRVRRVTCACLPAGLQAESAAPEATRFTLEPGAFLVMVTDGIADEGDDEWLQNLLAGWEGANPQALVSAILAESKQHKGLGDDCAVLAVYFPKENDPREI